MIVKIGMVIDYIDSKLELIVDNELNYVNSNRKFKIGTYVVYCEINDEITIYELDEIV